MGEILYNYTSEKGFASRIYEVQKNPLTSRKQIMKFKKSIKMSYYGYLENMVLSNMQMMETWLVRFQTKANTLLGQVT